MASLLNIKDTAKRLRIAEITLRRFIKKRSIPYHRIGYKYFFTEEDITGYLSNVSHPIIEEKNEVTTNNS
jgi:excisionase family DNA binding protein